MERLREKAAVFNLEVEGCHEYFANGILTHNCKWERAPQQVYDNMILGLRLGEKPQAIVCTTPQPRQIIKNLLADPMCMTVRASTFENLDNLAPTFRQTILQKYEGTRLGRQELYAEVLSDNPGALFKQSTIEANRVSRVPPSVEIVRVVVGVDPAGKVSDMVKFSHGMPTSKDDGGGDQAGIVVAGKGSDGNCYILHDGTTSGSPDVWGVAVKECYARWRADRVAWEGNHGGEVVRDVLTTVDPNISNKRVWSSRGKYIRAEPIASLAEQGRVKFVGDFPDLEIELTEWEPGRDSPNRLDAMVIAASELMIDPDYKEEIPFARVNAKGFLF